MLGWKPLKRYFIYQVLKRISDRFSGLNSGYNTFKTELRVSA